MKTYTQPITAVFDGKLMHTLCASGEPTPTTISVTPTKFATTNTVGD